MITLKPCPFCGDVAQLVELAHTCAPFKLKCRFCGASTNNFYTERSCINAWNVRAKEETK